MSATTDAALQWTAVCDADELDEDDAIRFKYDGKDYAIYRTTSGFYATDGICTHENAHLADGLVMDDIIECPMHQGRFHIPSGKAKSTPACIDLRTYPVKVEDSTVYLGLPAVS